MRIPQDDIAALEKQTGMCPLPIQDGIQYWEGFLQSEMVQGVALYGIPSRIAAYIDQKPGKVCREASGQPKDIGPAALLAKTEAYLKALISEEIKLAPDRISSSDRLESFGIDSVMISRINANLEKDLGALPKTLLYEHETVRELARFLLQETQDALVALLGVTSSSSGPSIPAKALAEEVMQDEVPPAQEKEVLPAQGKHDNEAIAIIGIHAYYPHSPTLNTYWENLKSGKDLTGLVPPDRWDYDEFYHPDPVAAAEGKIYCKWGGFLADYDKFDSHFFNIPPEEAKLIDPQERLFLESVWAAIEDAGYTRNSLRSRCPKGRSANVGVFVGVTTNSYHLWSLEVRARGIQARPPPRA